MASVSSSAASAIELVAQPAPKPADQLAPKSADQPAPKPAPKPADQPADQLALEQKDEDEDEIILLEDYDDDKPKETAKSVFLPGYIGIEKEMRHQLNASISLLRSPDALNSHTKELLLFKLEQMSVILGFSQGQKRAKTPKIQLVEVAPVDSKNYDASIAQYLDLAEKYHSADRAHDLAEKKEILRTLNPLSKAICDFCREEHRHPPKKHTVQFKSTTFIMTPANLAEIIGAHKLTFNLLHKKGSTGVENLSLPQCILTLAIRVAHGEPPPRPFPTITPHSDMFAEIAADVKFGGKTWAKCSAIPAEPGFAFYTCSTFDRTTKAYIGLTKVSVIKDKAVTVAHYFDAGFVVVAPTACEKCGGGECRNALYHALARYHVRGVPGAVHTFRSRYSNNKNAIENHKKTLIDSTLHAIRGDGMGMLKDVIESMFMTESSVRFTGAGVEQVSWNSTREKVVHSKFDVIRVFPNPNDVAAMKSFR